MFFWDPTFFLLIPALILAFYAQSKVKSAFREQSKVRNAHGLTGQQAALELLHMNGISDVEVEEIKGSLSDNYDPRSKKVRLSSDNYRNASLASVSVAAHEVGHAIQHAHGYFPLKLRHSILPATSFGSWLAFPLFLIGFLFRTPFLMDIGIIFFTAVVLFHIVTLPVEFDASNRAMKQLQSHGFLTDVEVRGAKKVLNAAALTYVAAAAMAALQLVRLLILRGIVDD